MSKISTTPAQHLPSKARILANALVDVAIDLILPTAVYALLAPTRLSAVIRLTIGGFFVAAKACAGRVSAAGESEGHVNFKRAIAGSALIASVCTAVTITTTKEGGSDSLAILLGTSVLVIVEGVNLFRGRRRLDGFALLVLLELAATIVLTSVNNDPRFVLMRPSFYTTIAAVFVLTTVWTARPFMMQVTKVVAAGGDPARAEAFERAGRQSPRFRRAEQAMTIGLALVLFAEAALRIVTVLSHPASDVLVSSLWSQVGSIGLFAIYFAVVKLVFVPRASREVDALMPTERVISVEIAR
jgi:hypothetical protein